MNTISTIYAWEPIELVMCCLAQDSAVRHRITEVLGELYIAYISRSAFDETKGTEIYQRAITVHKNIDFDSNYVCMAALAALHRYVEVS